MTTVNYFDNFINTNSTTGQPVGYIKPSSTAYGNIAQEPIIDAESLIQFWRLYSIPIDSHDALFSFLSEYPDLIQPLHELPSKITRYFPDASVSVSIVKTVADEEPIPELHFHIKSNLELMETRSRLSAIRKEWIYQLNVSGSEFVHITLES